MRKNNRVMVILLMVALLPHSLSTQSKSLLSETPSPRMGWDSLRNRLDFPAIAGRLDLRGPYEIRLNIGPDGHLDYYAREPWSTENFLTSDILDSALVDHIRNVLVSVSWNPAREKKNPVRSEIVVTLLYRGERAYIMYDHDKSLYWSRKPIDLIRGPLLIK